MITLSKAGDFATLESEEPQAFVQNYRVLRAIQKDFLAPVDDEAGCTGVWFWGAPGTGKSHAARAEYPGAYLKMCNKWWDGYQGEDSVIIDDLDAHHNVLCHHLKIWSDRYAFLAEVKGGARKIRPKKIVVTSQFSIEEVFAGRDPSDILAIRRRFEVRHFSELFRS